MEARCAAAVVKAQARKESMAHTKRTNCKSNVGGKIAHFASKPIPKDHQESQPLSVTVTASATGPIQQQIVSSVPSISETLRSVFNTETITTLAPSMDVSLPSSTINKPKAVVTSTQIAVPESESPEVTLAPLDLVLADGQNITIPVGTPVLGLQDPGIVLGLMLLWLILALLLSYQCLQTQ